MSLCCSLIITIIVCMSMIICPFAATVIAAVLAGEPGEEKEVVWGLSGKEQGVSRCQCFALR